jgi:ATP/maltotriose-dependent transcriptional regulator MalT
MVSHSTVKTYVQRIIKKLEVSDRTQASVKALDLGLLRPPGLEPRTRAENSPSS